MTTAEDLLSMCQRAEFAATRRIWSSTNGGSINMRPDEDQECIAVPVRMFRELVEALSEQQQRCPGGTDE